MNVLSKNGSLLDNRNTFLPDERFSKHEKVVFNDGRRPTSVASAKPKAVYFNSAMDQR